MIHKYRKIVPIKAEQFKATNKQLNDYHIGLERSKGHYHQVKSYYLPTKEGKWYYTLVITLLLVLRVSIGLLLRIYLKKHTKGWNNEVFRRFKLWLVV